MTVFAREDLQQRRTGLVNTEDLPDIQWQDAEQNGESETPVRRGSAHD